MAQKTVLVGVTGCIAAYKACELVRCLQKRGYAVKVVMTEHATEFVGPLTFSALTGELTQVRHFDETGTPISHIDLAQGCDAFIIAPCTGNVMAKIACGIADDLLTSTALACTAPMLVAPAMNVHMYEAAATQQNMKTLVDRGVTVIAAEAGYLACGEVGAGRLPDPSVLADAVDAVLAKSCDLAGKRVVITAGPTQEAIDPVRYISNPSSGKQGFALAEAARDRGAHVTLITGPVSLPDLDGVTTIRVVSACEMMDAIKAPFEESDIAIFSAAVSDMRPAVCAAQKLKKGVDDAALQTIELVENPDILSTCGHAKNDGQIVIGFAAETNNVLENAQKKLVAKCANAIVANDVSEGKGFGSNSNAASLVTQDGVIPLGESTKLQLAHKILDYAVGVFSN